MKSYAFKYICKGAFFWHGGTKWLKKSSRTAALAENPSRWFYFSKWENCTTDTK